MDARRRLLRRFVWIYRSASEVVNADRCRATIHRLMLRCLELRSMLIRRPLFAATQQDSDVKWRPAGKKNSQLVHTFYSTKSASERSRAASGKASMVIMPLHWRIGKTSEHSASRSDWHIIVADIPEFPPASLDLRQILVALCQKIASRFFFGADQSVTEFFGSRAG
ncbi:hypothetical protein L914_00147 [Phytophthora nicotianae]|uniref:Uncharacterized protein n=2 Tax=Phytophthora nicotianae TaxID=4792 RepID=V9G1E0_PHYNI|nr:hypothetical protein F443_00160 [Phytophthora nicotianae P1569]ETM56966.1 hypothetical protein L914_00147 [Phytophthora nicotianae]